MVKAKDVRGFMIHNIYTEDTIEHEAYREAISQQGNREITLNRERLINLIGEFDGNLNFEYHIKLADAIIAAEADIIESPTKDDK